MELRLGFALATFVSSYLPLFLMLLIKDVNAVFLENHSWRLWLQCPELILNNPKISIIAFTLSAICCIWLLWFKNSILCNDREDGDVVIVKSSSLNRGDMINYTLPFLVAFIGVDYGDTAGVAAFCVLMLFLFFFIRKLQALLLNPMLMVMGISLYTLTYTKEGDGEKREHTDTFICSDSPRLGDRLRVSEFSGCKTVISKNPTS